MASSAGLFFVRVVWAGVFLRGWRFFGRSTVGAALLVLCSGCLGGWVCGWLGLVGVGRREGGEWVVWVDGFDGGDGG